jgi:hypothetical protein
MQQIFILEKNVPETRLEAGEWKQMKSNSDNEMARNIARAKLKTIISL